MPDSFFIAFFLRRKKKSPARRARTTIGPAITAARTPAERVTLPFDSSFSFLFPPLIAAEVPVAPPEVPVTVPAYPDCDNVLVMVLSQVVVKVVVCTSAVMIVMYSDVKTEYSEVSTGGGKVYHVGFEVLASVRKSVFGEAPAEQFAVTWTLSSKVPQAYDSSPPLLHRVAQVHVSSYPNHSALVL